MSVGVASKRCGACEAEKPYAEFYVCSKHKDGRQHRCKKCQANAERGHFVRRRAPAPPRGVRTEQEIAAERDADGQAKTTAAWDVLAQQTAAAHG